MFYTSDAVIYFAACNDGYYGVNCSELCGNCAKKITCDRMTGYCESGCDEKHKGLRCKSSG